MKSNQRGRWKIGEALGEGGQGCVYKTKDENGKPRAIKIVRIGGGDKKKIVRIKREIDIIKQLKDAPNIVRIYDDNVSELDEKSEAPQEVYYVTDYARYGNLKQNDFYLNDIETSLRLFKEILVGVSQAHKQGIVHRDLKPENVLIYPTQKSVVVADFGLGRITAQTEGDNVTESDEILGPRYFMAPEQYKDPSKADARSDIYSLGKVLYYMLTGKGKIFREEIGDLPKEFGESNPYLPLIQEKLLDKMVTTDPQKRFDSVTEAAEIVEDILSRISGNSKRIIKKDDGDFSFYDVAIEGRLQEFVDGFAKDLPTNMWFLQMSAEELNEKGKQAPLTKLKTELLEKNPTGKAAAAIKATFQYIEEPDELRVAARSRYSFYSFYLAKYFENVDAHGEAHKHINDALDKEKDSELQLRYLLLLSEVCMKCSCDLSHDFSQRLTHLLRATVDQETKAKLYKMLGEHYLKRGDKAYGLRYIEAYLSIKPYDNKMRFTCAYEYSQIDLPAPSLYHYRLHAKANKKPDSYVENNMAVIFAEKDASVKQNAPIKALELYRKSSEHGNTLAASNIASLYLGIGLVEQAEKILRQVIADNPDGDYEERVDQVLGSIHRQREAEDELEKKLLDRGELLSKHHIESVRSMSSSQYDWAGYWELNIGPVIEIKQVDGSLSAGFRSSGEKALSLNFEGNSATVTKFEYSYTTYDHGVFYLTGPLQFKGYVQKGDEYKEITGTRIVDIVKHDEQGLGGLSKLLQARLG